MALARQACIRIIAQEGEHTDKAAGRAKANTMRKNLLKMWHPDKIPSGLQEVFKESYTEAFRYCKTTLQHLPD